ncbi:hypothetical protein WKW80_14535 [Variovorax humicola]|uniref:Uncharacterized protein n=1 Tax=Variovorax humicola TaxID=1769758 RepID=A0ABU8VZJ1_9BURK
MSSTSVHLRGGGRRMLIATLALALLYVAVAESWSALSLPLMMWYVDRGSQPALEREAAQVAILSATRETALTPAHRLAAWNLGLGMGYASQYLSGFANSPPAEQQRARAALEPLISKAEQNAAFLQVEGPVVIESKSVFEAASLRRRIEADDTGMEARIGERVSIRHRHLYQLGMHVGMQLAIFDRQTAIASRDPGYHEQSPPPRIEIKRHATLAGLSPAQWEPLAAMPSAAAYAGVAEAYRTAIAATDSSILAIPTGVAEVRQ